LKDSDDSDFDVSRAELFEAIGHPTRIKIIQVLGEAPMGFSELKRSVGIESGGLLSFHLRKLEQLVSMTDQGVYALTDQGKEALRMVNVTRGEPRGQTVRVSQPNKRRYLAVIVVLLLVLASVSAVALYQHSYLTGPTYISATGPTKTVVSVGKVSTVTETIVSVQNASTVIVTGFITFNSSAMPAQRAEWINFTSEGGKTYAAAVDPADQYWVTVPVNIILVSMDIEWRSLVYCPQNCPSPAALLGFPKNETTGFHTVTASTTSTSTCFDFNCPTADTSIALLASAGYTNETNWSAVSGLQTGYAVGGCVDYLYLGLIGVTMPVVIQSLTCS
jgi:DNA-binding HxlR family transcriptional regulator